MKVKTLKDSNETNKFLARDDIKVETITPFNDGRYCIVYKEKITRERTVYLFGCSSRLGTNWSRTPVVLSDSEYEAAKEEFIRTELEGESFRFTQRILKTIEETDWE